MSAKSNALENDLVSYVFSAAAPSWAAAASLYVSLHTGDPGEGGDQSTNECAYDGYQRVGVSRSGGWTITGGQAQNASQVLFPQCTSGSEVVTHFGLGVDSTGAGILLYKGQLTSPLNVSAGISPKFNASSITVTED